MMARGAPWDQNNTKHAYWRRCTYIALPMGIILSLCHFYGSYSPQTISYHVDGSTAAPPHDRSQQEQGVHEYPSEQPHTIRDNAFDGLRASVLPDSPLSAPHTATKNHVAHQPVDIDADGNQGAEGKEGCTQGEDGTPCETFIPQILMDGEDPEEVEILPEDRRQPQLGPAERVLVDDPEQFQAILASTLARKQKTFVLFTAALLSEGQPWCPDARAAEPGIWAALENPAGDSAVVVCRLPFSEWKSKTPHPYKKMVGLSRLPTLMRWGASGEEGRLVEDECKDRAQVLNFVTRNTPGEATVVQREATGVQGETGAHAQAVGVLALGTEPKPDARHDIAPAATDTASPSLGGASPFLDSLVDSTLFKVCNLNPDQNPDPDPNPDPNSHHVNLLNPNPKSNPNPNPKVPPTLIGPHA